MAALVITAESSGVSPTQRRRAGLLAGELGWVPEDLDAWLEIPPGTFLYGDEKETREISHCYWIGKYPVTNRQFGRFIAADGYARQELWSADGWAWREEERILEPAHWNDSELNSPLCPVVGVSWYEAEAYCRWLTRQLAQLAGGELPSAQDSGGWIVRLPTKCEWERAARGTDGRTYPWGDEEPSDDGANYDGLAGGTTPVGIYPEGVSGDGAADMAGNVWEWCMDDAGAHRVIRGGSWYDPAADCRSAYRLGFDPVLRLNVLGFRCARVQS
jgi:formylglycine-generating enzyme required for sulfatase activity